jgi:hypothetical protein
MFYLLNRIKEGLRVRFAELANAFEHRLHQYALELAALTGPLDVSTVGVLFVNYSQPTWH